MGQFVFKNFFQAIDYANQHNLKVQQVQNGYICVQLQQKKQKIDTSAFQQACKQFKDICKQIGIAINDPNFKGGFDQYTKFITSEFAKNNPAQASLFASMWSGANQYAKYQGSKIGLGQPEWWYSCWEQKK